MDYRLYAAAREGDVGMLRALLDDYGRWSRAGASCRGWGYPVTPDPGAAVTIDDETAAIVDRAVGALKRSSRSNAWRAFRLRYLRGLDVQGVASALRLGASRRKARERRGARSASPVCPEWAVTVHVAMELVHIGEGIVLEALRHEAI